MLSVFAVGIMSKTLYAEKISISCSSQAGKNYLNK
jgi:hypothetical protein